MTQVRLQIVSRDHARARVLKSIGLQPHAPAPVVRFELLRTLAWALTGGRNPVHVLRLLNRALDVAMGVADEDLGPEGLRAALRDALDELAMAGDIAELDGGLWVPAPTRLVPITGQDEALLVGGLPTGYLTGVSAAAISRKGPFRFVSRSSADVLRLPIEDIAEWARRPQQPLLEWAAQIMAQHLPEYEEPADGARIAFYVPHRAPAGAPQFKRWYERYGDGSAIGLAKRTRAFGSREYRVVEVVSGQVVRSGAALARGEARRLMYALDAEAHNYTRARWASAGAGGRLVLSSVLPQAEQRILAAFGSLTVPEERLYEQRWVFSSHGEQVRAVLGELSIQLTTE